MRNLKILLLAFFSTLFLIPFGLRKYEGFLTLPLNKSASYESDYDLLFDYPINDTRIQKIVEELNHTQDKLELIKKIEEKVKLYLRPTQKESYADTAKILELREGDCDDYARLFVTLARALKIPARVNFNSNHMWVEIILLQEGKLIIVDPTNSYDSISYTALN